MPTARVSLMFKVDSDPFNRPGRTQTPAAPTFTPQFISDLLARVDIVDVISPVVKLRKQGANLLGLCPFHQEKSPSFSVSSSKQFYHCFGCGASGDAISFVKEHAGLSFPEAVRELAQNAGVALPTGTQASPAQADGAAELIEANGVGAAFFRHCLRHDDEAIAYLKRRGLPSSATESFVIGYAPAGWNSLKEAFPKYASAPQPVACGLVIEKDGRRFDRFRSRLMFGIRDPRGRLLGFGGRSMDGTDPKYLNSPASPIFDKSTSLFGVYEARESIRKSQQVLVVEGYMDAVALACNGLPNVVATMGTACTPGHIERLCALSPEVVFAFDGDKAGRAAAWKSMLLCLPMATEERAFRFLILPDGRDPDEVILEEGAQAFATRVQNAQSLSTFVINELRLAHNDLKSVDDRARFAQDGYHLIERLPYAGSLRRVLRAEISRISTMGASSIQSIAEVNASTRKAWKRERALWDALHDAVQSNPIEARANAAAMLEPLDAGLQDAFFAQDFAKFANEQRDFWATLFRVVAAKEENLQALQAVASQTLPEIRQIQKDLIEQAPASIAQQFVQARRQGLREQFRSGAITESEMFQGLAAMPERG